MRYARSVKKIQCMHIGKDGIWEMTTISRFRKDCYWDIPLDAKEMKKYFKEKLNEDFKIAKKKGYKMFISFAYYRGNAGILI